MFNRCTNCHKYIYDNTKKDWCGCEAVDTWVPSLGQTKENAKTYYTKDNEELAAEIGENIFDDFPCDPKSFKRIVMIRDRYRNIEAYEVTAEATIDYSAKMVEIPKDQE